MTSTNDPLGNIMQTHGTSYCLNFDEIGVNIEFG